MAKSTYTLSIRMEEEYEKMLKTLEMNERLKADKYHTMPMSKTEIVKTAIKRYYADQVGGSLEDSYMASITSTLANVLDSYFQNLSNDIAQQIGSLKNDELKNYITLLLILKAGKMGEDRRYIMECLNSTSTIDELINIRLDNVLNRGGKL